MVSKLSLVAKIVVIAVVAVLLVYGSAYAVVSARTQARCVALSWGHSVVTYDFKQFCMSIYMGSEVIGPVDLIEKLVRQQGPGPQLMPSGGANGGA